MVQMNFQEAFDCFSKSVLMLALCFAFSLFLRDDVHYLH